MPPHSGAQAERFTPQAVSLTDRFTVDQEKTLLPSCRTRHVPTPLHPYNIVQEDGTSYFNGSLERIHELVDTLETDESYPDWLLNTIRESLMSAHARRCTQNSDALARHEIEYENSPFDVAFLERYEKAKQGRATTIELMELAADPHGLRAIELTKLSHPLDWEAANEMETELYSAIDAYDSNAQYRDRGARRRYKFQRLELDENGQPLAMVVTRKRDVAFMRRKLLVVKRSSLIVRFDDNTEDYRQMTALAEYVHRSHQKATSLPLKEGESQDEAFQNRMNEAVAELAPQLIEAPLSLRPADRPDWLAPTTTSYYCKSLERKPMELATEVVQLSLGVSAVSPSLASEIA